MPFLSYIPVFIKYFSYRLLKAQVSLANQSKNTHFSLAMSACIKSNMLDHSQTLHA